MASGADTASLAAPARSALEQAGGRALALNAYEAAARYYRAALELRGEWPRGRLLLGLGRALYLVGKGDPVAPLEDARDELLAAGDGAGAADAEHTLALHHWLTGDLDLAWEHLGRARTLVAELSVSPVKAQTIATAARFHMLANQNEEAIRLGREAITMAEQLGLDDVRAGALNNLGSARCNSGDEGGVADLTEAIRVAERANSSFELTRAKGNLAVQLELSGRLEAALALWQEALEDAESFGQTGFGRWFHAVIVYPLYALGRWDEALANAEAFLAEVEAGSPHYVAPRVYATRALIQLARGHAQAAAADAARALELVRRAADPQNLLPIEALVARIFHESGDETEAATLAGNYLAALDGETNIGYAIAFAHVAATTLATLGHGSVLSSRLRRYSQPWAAAGRAIAEGAQTEAAEILAGVGATAEEAFARLLAARLHSDIAQAKQALAFYRSVGGNRYVRECEALVATERLA